MLNERGIHDNVCIYYVYLFMFFFDGFSENTLALFDVYLELSCFKGFLT